MNACDHQHNFLQRDKYANFLFSQKPLQNNKYYYLFFLVLLIYIKHVEVQIIINHLLFIYILVLNMFVDILHLITMLKNTVMTIFFKFASILH